MPKRVLIIGGGVAGLAAATALRGEHVTLLEANNRFGGRVHSLPTPAGVVELGAEFLHGESESVRAMMNHARLTSSVVSERNQLFTHGQLQAIDVWEKFGELISHVDPQAPDTSFRELLATQSVAEDIRRMLLAFAEGFNAADGERISAHSLRRAEYSAQQMDGATQGRIDAGYGALIEHLVKEARAHGTELFLNSTVHRVDWQPGRVTVTAEQGDARRDFEAEAAVITLPLGVLKAGTVEFHPALPDKGEAIRGLEFGHVVKITLTFRRVWWPEVNFGFIHKLDEALPTWWSHAKFPILTGWVGGPAADKLLDYTPGQLEALALEILSRLFPGTSPHAELIASFTHNWTRDPLTRGAYTYIPVGGLFLPRQLAAPVAGTLFFAGEATAYDAQLGTVFSALESGQRAAREVMAS